MANRNIIHYAKEGAKKIPAQYDLKLSEIKALRLLAESEGLFQAFIIAYSAGFEAGHRANRKK